MPTPTYPRYNPNDPEKSFNELVRQLELKDNFNSQGNPKGVSGKQVKDKTITDTNMQDNSVTNRALAIDAVTTSIIASAAVGTSELQNGAVTTSILGDDSVTSTKIYTAAVNASAMATSAVGFVNMQSSAVYGAVLASAAVSNGHLQTSVINKENMNIPIQYSVGPFSFYIFGSSVAAVGNISRPYHYSADIIGTSVSAGSVIYLTPATFPTYLAPQNCKIKSLSILESLAPLATLGTSASNNVFKAVMLKNDTSISEFSATISDIDGNYKKAIVLSTVGVSVAQGDRLSLICVRLNRATADSNVPSKILDAWINLELD